MDCKEFREVLDLYVDGELSPDAATGAHLHLQECARCRRVEGEVLRLRSALRENLSRHQPPPELVNMVSQVTQPWWRKLPFGTNGAAQGGRQFWKGSVAVPAPVFALLLAGVLVFGGLYLSLRSERKPDLAGQSGNPAAPSVPANDALVDVSRFDQGGRARIYKAHR